MSENTDEISRLGRQLDKAVEVLGLMSTRCPSSVGLKGEEVEGICPRNCRNCWEIAISEIE